MTLLRYIGTTATKVLSTAVQTLYGFQKARYSDLMRTTADNVSPAGVKPS